MKSKASLTSIFLTVFIDLLGFGILIPILPTFASKELYITDFQIGMIVAIYSFVQFLFNPVLGKLSDKIGRRPIILSTLALTGISYIIFSFAHSFWMLFLSRLIAGLGGSNIGVAQAYIADITTEENRSKGMGLIGAAFGLGFVFGPMMGGWLSGYGYNTAGYAASLFSFSALIFSFFTLKESVKVKPDKVNFKINLFDRSGFKKAFGNLRTSVLIMLFFIIVFSMANIYGTFSLIGYKLYHFSDLKIGYLYGVIGLVGAVIQGGLIKKISSLFSENKLLASGLLLMTIGLAGIPYGGNFAGVVTVVILLAVGTGILQPVILGMVSKYSPVDSQGEILGINQSLASLARVLGPLWGGFSFDYLGYEFPFLTGGFFTLFTLVIFVFMLNKLFRKNVQN